MAEERIIGAAGDPNGAARATIHKRQSYPKEEDYCVACCTSATGGASEIVAAFGPFCHDEAQEIASEMQAMESSAEGANYYPRRLCPAELRRVRRASADERKLKRR